MKRENADYLMLSVFFFPNNVIESLSVQDYKNFELCGKGLSYQLTLCVSDHRRDGILKM